MMNNKEQFSPMAALGSGTICLAVFGGTWAPLLMGVLFNNNTVVYESVSEEGREYTATYMQLIPPSPPAPPASDSGEKEESEPGPPAEEKAEVELVIADADAPPVIDPEPEVPTEPDSESEPESVPETLPEPETEVEAIVEARPEIEEDPDRIDPSIFIEDVFDEEEEEVEIDQPITDIEEAVVEAEVEDPGCPGDTRIETLSSDLWYVHRELVEYYAQRPWKIREIAGTWRSRDDSGTPIGFRVRPTECSILFNAGFESNDIVTSINGRVVTSALEGIQAYFVLRRDKIFDVRILREGEEVALNFVLEETEKEKARIARLQDRAERRQRRATRPRLFSRDRGEAIVDAHEE